MRKLTSLVLSILCSVLLWSCEKSQIEVEPGLSNQSPITTQTMAANVEPTSVSKGMKNYESYFVSSKDGNIHGYIISTPLNYDPNSSTKYPLLVFMHGDGEKPSSSEDYNDAKLKYHGPHKEIFSKGRAFPAIIVSIQMAKYESVVNPAVVKELIDVITGAVAIPNPSKGAVGLGKYNIDMDRIHLTGLSQGGNGAYKTAYTYPDFFASISVFSGYAGSQADMSKIKMPVYIRHNSNDPTVQVYNAYNAQKWINDAGPIQPVDLLIFNSSSHDAWTTEYGRTDAGNVYDWHWAIVKNKGNVGVPPVVVPPSNSDLTVSTYYPAINSSVSATKYGSISILFNKNIRKQSGLIQVKNLTDNTTFNAYASWGMVSANANKLTLYPVELQNNKRYAVTIERGTIADENGLPFAGITDDKTWTFDVGSPTTDSASGSDGSTTSGRPVALSVNTFSPANNATISRPSNGYINLALTFNQVIQNGYGLVEVKNITDNTSFKVYANWGMVSVKNSIANLYPVPVVSGKTYAVTIDNNSFKDASGNFYNGISNTSTWKFTVK